MEENTDKHDGCSNPQCECNSATKQEDYLEPYYLVDHEHCWEDEDNKPPCGQRIEHFKCCLCEMRNPIVASEITKARIEVLEEVEREILAQIDDEDFEDTQQNYRIAAKIVRSHIQQQKVPSPNILLI